MICKGCSNRLMVLEEVTGRCRQCSVPMETASERARYLLRNHVPCEVTKAKKKVTSQKPVTPKPVTSHGNLTEQQVTSQDVETKQQRWKRKNAEKAKESHRLAQRRRRGNE